MPFIPHNRLTFGNAECEAVAQTVRSGQWAQGPRVQELESVLAGMAGVRYAVCVSSGFSALRLALGALGVESSDTIVVPGGTGFCGQRIPESPRGSGPCLSREPVLHGGVGPCGTAIDCGTSRII